MAFIPIRRFNNINDRNYKDLWFYSNPIFVNPITNEEIVTNTINKLTLGDLNDVKTHIQLPTTGENGATIQWQSSMPSVIGHNGQFIARQPNNTMLTLTATIKRGDVSKTKSFQAIVKGVNPATIELHGKLNTANVPYVNDTWTNQNVTLSVYASVYAPSTSSIIELSLDGVDESSYKPYASHTPIEIKDQGEHRLNFRATDNTNQRAYLSYTVKIDKEIPVISLVGAQSIRLSKGSIYNEQGATAKDNFGLSTKDVLITGSVNTSKVGTYEMKYNIRDLAGNAANEVVRTIIVYEEQAPDPDPDPTPQPPAPTKPDPEKKPENEKPAEKPILV